MDAPSEFDQAPTVSVVCYCSDCQEGGRRIEALSGAPRVLDVDGGASYLTYFDDRFRCVAGADKLVATQLSDRAPTRRMEASCCNLHSRDGDCDGCAQLLTIADAPVRKADPRADSNVIRTMRRHERQNEKPARL